MAYQEVLYSMYLKTLHSWVYEVKVGGASLTS